MHGIEEEGLVAVVLASEVSWCAEQGLLVLVVVEMKGEVECVIDMG